MKKVLIGLAIAMATATSSFADSCNKEEQVHALAMNMYHEARGEGSEEMQLIAEVTLNRVENKHFPNTICEVVYQARFDPKGNPRRYQCQFSWFCDGRSDKAYDAKSWKYAEEIAEGLVSKTISLIGIDATHYHTKDVKPYWSKSYDSIGMYGNHIFYTMGDKL